MRIVNLPKLSNGEQIIPIKYHNGKIIVQIMNRDKRIKGFYKFDIEKELFEDIFTLADANNDQSSLEMLGFHPQIEILKGMNEIYFALIEEFEDSNFIKFYEMNLTSYVTNIVFEYVINPGFYYKGISYLKDGFFLFQLGNEKHDDLEHNLLFLYDVKEKRLYPVTTEDSFRMTSGYYGIFREDSSNYLFFDEWYIQYYEEEDLISNQHLLSETNINVDFGHLLNNSFNVIELNHFIQQIKSENAENKNNEYTIIDSNNLDGWIRYCGMNEENLYYLRKLYKNSNIELFRVSKRDFKVTLIKNLNKIDNIKNICIGSQDNYLVNETDAGMVIQSLSTNATIFTYFKDAESAYERFVDLVNDRYIILCVATEGVNEDSEFMKLIDMSGGAITCTRDIAILDDRLVLVS